MWTGFSTFGNMGSLRDWNQSLMRRSHQGTLLSWLSDNNEIPPVLSHENHLGELFTVILVFTRTDGATIIKKFHMENSFCVVVFCYIFIYSSWCPYWNKFLEWVHDTFTLLKRYTILKTNIWKLEWPSVLWSFSHSWAPRGIYSRFSFTQRKQLIQFVQSKTTSNTSQRSWLHKI